MNRIHVRGVTLAMLVAVAACGDSTTEVVGDLSQAEAEALAEVVGSTMFSSATSNPPDAQAGAPSRTPVSGSESISGTLPCELGGTVTVSGDLEFSGDTETQVDASYSITQVHDGCVAASQDGIVFTLDGAPSVSAGLNMSISQSSLSMDGGYQGAVDWATDDSEGTCTVDITLDIEANGLDETVSASMAGTVCGISISKTLDIG